MIRTILCAALLLLPASAFAAEVSDFERFQLWNKCRPLELVVGVEIRNSDLVLKKADVEVAARSKLRAARLFSEDTARTKWSMLVIQVSVVSHGFTTKLDYAKVVQDQASKQLYPGSTWSLSSVGVQDLDPDSILSGAGTLVDNFIDAYLRVNEDSC